MQLSYTERWILANQLKILEALYPDEAENYKKDRIAIERGYELHYGEASDQVLDDPMTYIECYEIVEIFNMFLMIKQAYETLEDKEGIQEWATRYQGFDGNTEPRRMQYAEYFYSLDPDHWGDLAAGGDFNSHTPQIEAYRRMLAEWKQSRDPLHLTKGDLVRITSVRVVAEE